jgi:hypothetical protein
VAAAATAGIDPKRLSGRIAGIGARDHHIAFADRDVARGRRAVAASTHASIGNHSFRPAEITAAFVSNCGKLEHAQKVAAHESPRTTKLYDCTKERHAGRGGAASAPSTVLWSVAFSEVQAGANT